MFSNKFKLINSNNTPEQNHFQEHPSTQEKPEFEENLFRLNHLNIEEKSKLITLLKKFKNIQYREGDNLTCTNQQKHTINTTQNIPIYAKPYGYSQAYESEVENQIQDMLKQKIIRESNSPYCSPICLLPKKLDASGQKKYSN